MNAVLAPKPDAPLVKYKSSAVGNVVGAFESETAAVFMRTAPVRQHIILYALVAILAISVVLAAIVKLDRVVTSVGRIVPTAGAMYVSPFDTGIVKQINVKAGDVVKKGQVLATLDPTFTHADLLQLQQKLASDEAAVARLEAELAGKKYKYSSTDPAESLQGGIWQKRQAEYQSNLDDFDGRIRSLEAQIAQAQADTKGYAQRLKAAQDVEKLYKPLLEKGYVSKLQAMQAADESTERARLLALAVSVLLIRGGERVGLADAASLKVSQLSKGMKMRLNFCRANLHRPDLLFLDEPTAGLDPDRSDSFVSLIQALHQQLNLTVVMVTHDLDTLFALSNRIAVLAEKKVVTIGAPQEVVTFHHPFIEKFFLGGRGMRAMEVFTPAGVEGARP